jgi:hypothetical protein
MITGEAWIGLRAEGTVSKVEWSWSNGRRSNLEIFSTSEMRKFDELAVRENKKCLIAKNIKGQINWLPESCDARRPFLCSYVPDNQEFEESLSRAKRQAIVVNNRGSRPDVLETLNEQQNNGQYDPKMAQFAPVDNLVVKSVQEQYPPTSSLADQQECVDAIEGNVIQTSQKVTDLDKKIAETVKNNRDIEARLDQMENEIERMNSGIDSINKVTDNIKAADELITEADSITQNLITEMDELEDISSEDFKIPEIKERIEEYNTFDFEDANGKVKLARERARDLRNKLVELRNLWSIADENCEVVDSGQVSCELPIDSTVYAQMLYKIQHMVNEAKVNEQTANDGLKDLISQSNGYAQCKLPDSNPPVDFVAQKNTFDKLERELEDLNLEVLQETPNPNWDRIDKIYNDVNKLYQEIREVLYGPDATDEDISSDPKNWDKIYGLDGAINFLSNPACWRLGEECDFPTGDVASQDPVTQ